MVIAIVDDHRLLTEALSNCLRNNTTLVQEVMVYNSPKSFLDLLTKGLQIDILVADLIMPEIPGIELITRCLQMNAGSPDFKIIVMTSVTNPQMVRHVLSIGAKGFLTKDISLEELQLALVEVYQGNQYIAKSVEKKLLRSFITEEQINFYLTPRETQVLAHLCKAKTVKEIAYEMQLSLHTVLSYQKNIMRKFKMNRTIDLVAFAIEHGIYSETHNTSPANRHR
ncbi:response regulator transcription factor [Taibaiella chishuiensis]|uniref:DNA-binding NarL/FixJ family response regulator n=1 Tax=Taibaiella chishuiensis TaxID=1434707 RepID=A0A2P8CT38_9BACT|nr:response regulator transcription factor [Taibaiella chishuiensis]PSK88135.1 DNA-binding NarL/FixJ family response regulator [Taibaiella chishuiensis]